MAPFGASWRALGPSLASYAPLLGALGSVLLAFVSPNLRTLSFCIIFSSEFRRFAIENTPKACANMPKTCESTPKTCQLRCASNVGFQQGCGGRAKRVQSAAPCVYAGSEAFIDSSSYSRTPSELGELASPYPSTGLRESAVPPRSEEFFSRSTKLFLLLASKVASLAALGLCSAASTPLLGVLGCFFY